MSVTNFQELIRHVGHDVHCVAYGGDQAVNATLECWDCNEVLVTFDREEEDTPMGEDPETECPQCHKLCRESEITFLNRGYCNDCLLVNMGLKERED